MPPRIITSRHLVQERLPDLRTTTSQTKSSAIHDIKFIGTLEPWPAFEPSVLAAFNGHNWTLHRAQLELRPVGDPSPASLLREHPVVGHEGGVQGRWQQHIGAVMTAVFEDQLHPPSMGLEFGDFKASTTPYRKEPDVACMDTVAGTDRFIVELKVPWVEAHSLRQALSELSSNPDRFRKILGQPAEYMKDLNRTYGAISTYNETVFLRQFNHPTLGWRLQYSPVVLHTTSAPQGVSVRQCMWFLAQQVQAMGYVAVNPLPDDQWVEET